MAIYHLSASTGSKAGGQSAGAKADYLARADKYKKERDEVALVESGNMPEWVRPGTGRAAGASMDYWRQADSAERSNGVLFRQVEFSLPVELSPPERIDLARQFAAKLSQTDGGRLPYTLAVHEKNGNPHAHLMLSERINDGIERDRDQWFKRGANKGADPATGGARKADIASRRKDWLETTRAGWQDMANEALAKKGKPERIDHRSLSAQGIDREPTRHVGPQARAIEAKGIPSWKRQALDVRHAEDTARRVQAQERNAVNVAARQAQQAREDARHRLDGMTAAEIRAEIAALRADSSRFVATHPAVVVADRQRDRADRRHSTAREAADTAREVAADWKERHPTLTKAAGWLPARFNKPAQLDARVDATARDAERSLVTAQAANAEAIKVRGAALAEWRTPERSERLRDLGEAASSHDVAEAAAKAQAEAKAKTEEKARSAEDHHQKMHAALMKTVERVEARQEKAQTKVKTPGPKPGM
jgi:hypothetical protein